MKANLPKYQGNEGDNLKQKLKSGKNKLTKQSDKLGVDYEGVTNEGAIPSFEVESFGAKAGGGEGK